MVLIIGDLKGLVARQELGSVYLLIIDCILTYISQNNVD